MYVPKSMWPEMKERLISITKQIKMGQPEEFDIFMTAVIDNNAWNDHKSYVDYAKQDSSCQIVVGGECDNSKGYFISPTIIETTDPHTKTMKEEIFGPVLTVLIRLQTQS